MIFEWHGFLYEIRPRPPTYQNGQLAAALGLPIDELIKMVLSNHES